MSYINVWIHLIWSTKNREPYLTKELRSKIFSHIRENAKEKHIHIDSINGYKEHVHLLISMNQNQTIAKIVHLLKGESTYWININKLTKNRFCWQKEYGAVSVGYSALKTIREYINNQETHHQNRSFTEEFNILME